MFLLVVHRLPLETGDELDHRRRTAVDKRMVLVQTKRELWKWMYNTHRCLFLKWISWGTIVFCWVGNDHLGIAFSYKCSRFKKWLLKYMYIWSTYILEFTLSSVLMITHKFFQKLSWNTFSISELTRFCRASNIQLRVYRCSSQWRILNFFFGGAKYLKNIY